MSTTLSEGISQAILTNSRLAALVGSNVFAFFVPQTVAESDGVWIAYTRISNQEEAANDGNQHLQEARYQFDVGSKSYPLVSELRDALIAELNGSEFLPNPGKALAFFHVDDGEEFDPETRIYRARIDFSIQANN